jgi:hypothetical protein
MQQQQQPGGPVPTYRNVQGLRTKPPNQRTTYNVQRTTYGTYIVLSIPAVLRGHTEYTQQILQFYHLQQRQRWHVFM